MVTSIWDVSIEKLEPVINISVPPPPCFAIKSSMVIAAPVVCLNPSSFLQPVKIAIVAKRLNNKRQFFLLFIITVSCDLKNIFKQILLQQYLLLLAGCIATIKLPLLRPDSYRDALFSLLSKVQFQMLFHPGTGQTGTVRPAGPIKN